jgi:hypothetical protein
MRIFWRRLTGFLRGNRMERELNDEIGIHLALQEENSANVAWTPLPRAPPLCANSAAAHKPRKTIANAAAYPGWKGCPRPLLRTARPPLTVIGVGSTVQ